MMDYQTSKEHMRHYIICCFIFGRDLTEQLQQKGILIYCDIYEVILISK